MTDDRIFVEWASQSTIGLGHGLDLLVGSLPYSSFYTIKVAKNGFPTDWPIFLCSDQAQSLSSNCTFCSTVTKSLTNKLSYNH